MKKRFSTRADAMKWLSERYDDQNERYPLLGPKVSKDLYMRRNIRGAMRMTISDEEE